MADTFLVIGTGPTVNLVQNTSPVNIVLSGAGASAYQIWLDAGNTGTEQDFLDSLEGPQGATGATGPQGDPGFVSLNGLTNPAQTFAAGTSGTDFNISSSGTTHTFNFPSASASNRGLLLAMDWATFNAKIGGSGAAGQVGYWSGVSSQAGSNNLFWDNTNQRISIGTTTATYQFHMKSVGTTNQRFIGLFNSSGVQQASFDTDGSGNGALYCYDNAGVIKANINGGPISFIINGFGIGTQTLGNASFRAAGRQNDIGIVPISLGNSGGGYPLLAYNVNFTASNGVYQYRSGDTAFGINLGAGNRIGFNVAAAGTAGNTISFTEVVSFLQNGNVGIGTTTPASKLDVEGGAAVGATYAGTTAAPTNGLIVEGNTGIKTNAPLSALDVNGANGYSQLRLRTSYTPTSSADALGNTGDTAWDANYFYIKTSAGWKRAALSTF